MARWQAVWTTPVEAGFEALLAMTPGVPPERSRATLQPNTEQAPPLYTSVLVASSHLRLHTGAPPAGWSLLIHGHSVPEAFPDCDKKLLLTDPKVRRIVVGRQQRRLMQALPNCQTSRLACLVVEQPNLNAPGATRHAG
ncbi:MAG: hypothetical protein L0219_21695, partial [Phycisphaerales bacterium]|nr:hypothetical protein [Phycisphaerales bacterium]